MQSAPHEVDCRQNLLETVELAVRQRLGKERTDLWFGSGTRWILADSQTIRIEVASEFLANCIVTMFRNELQSVVTQHAGPDWGVMVAARKKKSGLQTDSEPHASEAIAYHGQQASRSPEPPLPAKPSVTASASLQSSLESTQEPHDAGVLSDAGGPSLRLVRPDRPKREAPAQAADLDREVDRLAAQRRHLDRRWDEFLVGEHNRFAYTGAQMVLERPGHINPLLIHGPNGVGKSHLAMGLAQRLRQQYRMRRVLVLTGEQFTIEYTESARGGGFANFRRKYRDVEALVIDDVQFCLGKQGTLSELRNTIDMLLRDTRQVILVSDRGLNELGGLGTDLYARLSGGMCCGIEPMDPVTRRELLGRLCAKQNLAICDESLEMLAAQCGGDARLLQGIVHRLAAQHRLQGTPLQPEDALRCTMDLIRASQPIVRLSDIEKVVCDAFGLPQEMLRAKTKCQSISQPRMLAMFLARKYTRSALSEIGEFFGKRQHSTVISAQKKVEQWLSGDDAIALGRSRINVREIVRTLEATLQVG
jgi:chromosomal replication initiator protein